MASFDVLAVVISILGLASSITYYAIVLQNQNKTRQTQMLMELYSAYRDYDFAKIWGEVMDYEYADFDDFWEKYGGPNNRDTWSKWQSVARLFNGMGVLVKRNLVDIELVEELLSVIIICYYCRLLLQDYYCSPLS